MWGVSFLGYGPIKEAHHKKQSKEKINLDTQIPLTISPPIFFTTD
jgi:hypothetical protein